jgi:hypothetical protein
VNLQNFPRVLFCDNCSSHINELIKQLLPGHNIRLIALSPHVSHLLEPIDFLTFAAFKREKRERYVVRPAGSQVWQITKLMKVLEHVTDSINNRAVLRRAGLMVNPQIFLPVMVVILCKLNGLINASNLSEAPEVDRGIRPPADRSRGSAIPIFGP